VVNGIEKANRILIPSLFVLLIIAGVRAITLPGAVKGLNFLFEPNWKALLNYKIWLEGLSQSAWSTGAGWGLILTTERALEVVSDTGPASTGLTFIWIPKLFEQISAGKFFLVLFFLALSIAALSSLISMIELGTRIMMDFGLTRRKGIAIVGSVSFLLGLPSALSLTFFQNQDWVWGVGLLLSGFFFAITIIRYGVEKFRLEMVDSPDNDIRLGRIFNFTISILIPVEFVMLISWWFAQVILKFDPHFWWHPFRPFSIGTCLLQWGALIVILILLNKKIKGALAGSFVPVEEVSENAPQGR